jgi:uncharacterized protein (DUF2344 family)
MEFVPYDQFKKKLNSLLKKDFKLYKATWIDGPIKRKYIPGQFNFYSKN